MIEGFDITGGDPSKVGYYVGLMVCELLLLHAHHSHVLARFLCSS
jgi:hypothetical protein